MRPENFNIPEFVQQLLDGLPKDLTVLRADLEKNCRAALSSLFERMDLVTREEFDTQVRLQQRLRAILEELEQRLAALENPAQSPAQSPDPEQPPSPEPKQGP